MKIYATPSITLRLRSVALFVIAAVFIAPVLAQTNESQGVAKIASVTAISPKGWQTIVIKGAHFGTNPPINGCPDHMRVTDVTTNWSVPAVDPFGGCQAGIFVSSWNDNEIVIEGFPSFQQGQDAFKLGDVIKIEVGNQQQYGAPMAWYSLRVTPEETQAPAPAAAPPSPPQPPPQVLTAAPAPQPNALTLPAGTSITVRMIDSVDSSKNKVGDTFHASLDNALVVGEAVVAPKGADVYGKLAQAKSAGKISGGAELTLEMTGIQIGGNVVPVDCTDSTAVTKGRGKQSAAVIGGSTAVGAVIGGIFGGRKGAAIGAGTGAGAGTAVQLATHGRQINIPSETVLEFKLQEPVTVSAAGSSAETNTGTPPPVEPGPSSNPTASGEAPAVTVTSFGVGFQPTGVASDGANIWVANNSGNSVTELQPNNGNVIGTFPTGPYPTGLAYDGTNIWVANFGHGGSNNTVTVLSAATGRPLPFSPVTAGRGPRMLAFDGANIWVTNNGGNTVTKLRPSDGTTMGTYTVGSAPAGIAFDGSNIWVVNVGSDDVTKLASNGTALGTYPLGSKGGFGIAFDGAHMWISTDGGLKQLALNGTILQTVAVDTGAMVAFDGINIWVANYASNSVVKVLANSGKVLGTFSVPGNPWGVAFDGASIWASNFAGSNVWKFSPSKAPGSAGPPVTSTSNQSAVASVGTQGGDIHSVDFRNLQYRPDCLNETIRVSNGEWKEVKENEQSYFRIVSTSYGDLNGDGQDEAAVLGACGGVANFEIGDIIIFSMSPSGPRLLAQLSPPDWGKGEEDNGGDFQVTDVHVSNRQLAVSFLAGGFHACPAWTVTAKFQWNGNGFARTGVDHTPFKCH